MEDFVVELFFGLDASAWAVCAADTDARDSFTVVPLT